MLEQLNSDGIKQENEPADKSIQWQTDVSENF